METMVTDPERGKTPGTKGGQTVWERQEERTRAWTLTKTKKKSQSKLNVLRNRKWLNKRRCGLK